MASPALLRRCPAPGLLLALALVACRSQRDLDAVPPPPRPERGMVVSEHPLASEVGAHILEAGGNAADAAVAAALALAVVYPQAGNLGGGGFALWVPHVGEPMALDFRETAPARASRALYLDAQGEPVAERQRWGALSVGVPGSPAGLYELHQRLGSGRFSFSALVRPAIELARGGFEVDASLARTLAGEALRRRLELSPGARRLFYPGGEPLREGDRLVQTELAETLSLLAREGPRGFYRGPTARRVVAELQAVASADSIGTGYLTLEDLDAYRIRWREPLRGWFRGHELITMPPPSSGGIILLQVLSVLDGFPLDAARAAAAQEGGAARETDEAGIGPRIAHWWIEALRRSFAERAEHMGDPDFHPVPVEHLLSSDWVANCRVSIGELAAPDVLAQPWHEGSQTTHLSVLDRAGDAVSLTTTLNSSFGSGLFVGEAGFLLNNELDDFALGGGVANQFGLVGQSANWIEPGKRPLSSMTPTVVRRGGRTVGMVLGSPGGPRIITAVTAVVLRTLVFGQDLAAAVAAPRLHQQWSPVATALEDGWPEALLEELRRRGHELTVGGTWASVQAIWVDEDGTVTGASDPRRGGAAVAAEAH